MISKDTLKRINALERALKHKKVPFLIIAEYDDESKSYLVNEYYTSPRFKRIVKTVNDLESYTIPEGFDGTFIHGAEQLED